MAILKLENLDLIVLINTMFRFQNAQICYKLKDAKRFHKPLVPLQLDYDKRAETLSLLAKSRLKILNPIS